MLLLIGWLNGVRLRKLPIDWLVKPLANLIMILASDGLPGPPFFC